ncbi:MAG: hypothetical protein CMM95_02505 [Rickettsiales bacterium]|nr:hypothetical protein [Rickettsiales bacterium]
MCFSFFLFFFVLFSISNKYPVKVNFFPLPFFLEIPLYFLILIVFFLGLILGCLFVYMRKIF